MAAVVNRALETFLSPLRPILGRPDVSEVSINRPGEVFIEQGGRMAREPVSELSLSWLHTLVELIAQDTGQVESSEQPLLSASLPTGERVQVVYPPACGQDTVVFSIRKQTVKDLSLDDYEAAGAFEHARKMRLNLPEIVEYQESDAADSELNRLLTAGKIREFLGEAVREKKTILVSGGTSTGKTTLLNAVLKEIPSGEQGDRIITIEDVPELVINQPNAVSLIASKGEQGIAKVTPTQLLEACLRLRPDRIIMGEVRGKEVCDFLEALNTGHEGSVCSVHANSVPLAFERLAGMGLRSGLGVTRESILRDAAAVLDIVLQITKLDARMAERLGRTEGERLVTEIYYRGG